MFTDERDLSNYIGFNIKEKLDGTFKLLQSHLVEKIINRVGITVSTSLKARDTPTGKQLPNKDECSLVSKCVWNYREVVGMLSYLWGSTQPEISMAIH